MYHQISIKGLIIIKKKSTYHFAMRSIIGLSRSPGDRSGERSDPEGSKGREGQLIAMFMYHQISIKALTIRKNKSTDHYALRIRISYMINVYRVDPRICLVLMCILNGLSLMRNLNF